MCRCNAEPGGRGRQLCCAAGGQSADAGTAAAQEGAQAAASRQVPAARTGAAAGCAPAPEQAASPPQLSERSTWLPQAGHLHMGNRHYLIFNIFHCGSCSEANSVSTDLKHTITYSQDLLASRAYIYGCQSIKVRCYPLLWQTAQS